MQLTTSLSHSWWHSTYPLLLTASTLPLLSIVWNTASASVVPSFTSYLSHRQQFVWVGDCRSSIVTCIYRVPQSSVLGPLLFFLYISLIASRSSIVTCIYGVPQGSVLGPLLFFLYISLIASIIARQEIHQAQYAECCRH